MDDGSQLQVLAFPLQLIWIVQWWIEISLGKLIWSCICCYDLDRHSGMYRLLMVRRKVKEPKVDSELIYAYAKIDFDGPAVGEIAAGAELFEEAFAIFKKKKNCAGSECAFG